MPTFPFLLAHGVARFDFLRKHFIDTLGLDDDSLGDATHYFRNVRSYLAAHGFGNVHHTSVGFADSVDVRAANLKSEVERVLAERGAEKVHIIAHSMGGLDARRMIVDLGMAGSVCSLTTVGTPHHGSSFADWGREHHADAAVHAAARVINLEGFLNLVSEDTAAFNARAEAAEADNKVVYQTYACWEVERGRVFGPLQLTWDVIKEREGDNDGLVSVTSQRWTETLRGAGEKTVAQHDFPVFGDHLNEVGWWEPNQLAGKLRLGALLNPRRFAREVADDRREYENQIKNTYLTIAQDLEGRFPTA